MEINKEKFKKEHQEGLQCVALPYAHKAPPLQYLATLHCTPSKLPPGTGFHDDVESLSCC